MLVDGRLQDAIGGYHHPKIDHLVAVAPEHDADDVLADIVDVAFDRREHDLAFAALLFLPGFSALALGPHPRRELTLTLHRGGA